MTDTFFAPAGRRGNERLAVEISAVTRNPVIDAVLTSVSGLLAVLNERRQILAINDALIDMLGISDASQIPGLRPGEAIGCAHSAEGPDGCGTSRYCSFTTKPGAGRGIGTGAMKLFGEEALGGAVSFETNRSGTTFHLNLPL